MTRIERFVSLIKGRKPYPVGTIRTGKDGIKRRKNANGQWVPVKTRKQYKVGDTRTKAGKRFKLHEDGKWRSVGKKKRQTSVRESSAKPTISKVRAKLEVKSRELVYNYSNMLKKKPMLSDILKKNLAFISRPEYIDMSVLPQSVQSYFGTAHDVMNDYLRVGKSGVDEVASKYEMTVEDVIHMASPADEILKYMEPLQTNMSLFRGLDTSQMPSFEIHAGMILPMQSFMSTSTDEDVADTFVEGMLLKIDVPKGTKALVTNMHEREVLFPYNEYSLKIDSVSGNEASCSLVPK